MQSALIRLRQTYPHTLRFVFKDFPLSHVHERAHEAARAARCAGDQGKYWEYHDVLFAHPNALEPEQLHRYAAELGLDVARFEVCLDERIHTAAVDNDLALGRQLGVTGTPAFFINGRFLSGAQPYEVFVEAIGDALARRPPRGP